MPGALLVTGNWQVRKTQSLSEFNDVHWTVLRGKETFMKKENIEKESCFGVLYFQLQRRCDKMSKR